VNVPRSDTKSNIFLHIFLKINCVEIKNLHVFCKSRDISVGIALGYGLDDRDSRV
jgi:hypothetical protein